MYHAEDAQSHAIAALVRHCDAQTHRQFQFLEVDGPASLRRMQRFLQQHNLQRSGVKMPFIILVDAEHRDAAVRRSILYGAALQQWLAEMVDALLDTPAMTPSRVRQMFLDPFISPHVLRLLRFALTEDRRPKPEIAEPFVPPPAPSPIPPPPPPAYVEELPDTVEEDEGEEDMLVDTGVTMTVSTVPGPKSSGGREKLASKARKDIDHLQDAKARDAMIQRKTW
jgi:hypothetical protein